MLPFEDGCVDDPCTPNPCDVENMNRCVAALPGNHSCECNPGYIADGAQGCMVNPDANDWAFLVFLNADNNLEEVGFMDVAEMGTVGSTPDVHIASLFDTYQGTAQMIYVTQGDYDVMEDWGEQDMSDWRTLRDFGVWAVDNFPAKHYALIMWDHGAGWRASTPTTSYKGFSNDEHGTQMEISISNGDYAQALSEINNALGGKIDIVGFDACLMGMWEVAAATAPYANYLVASQETEPFEGWAYHGFLPGLANEPDMNPEQLAVSIVDAYYEESQQNSTLSVIHLDTQNDLDAAISNFADSLMNNNQLYDALYEALDNTQRFYDMESVDLEHFAQNVAELPSAPVDVVTAAMSLIAQLETSVVYNLAQPNYPNANGLSIYLPMWELDPSYTGEGAVWSQNTTWDEFLVDFFTQI